MTLKYDDASWHYGGTFPGDLPQEAGATHIGMYLTWAVLAGLASTELSAQITRQLSQLKARAITPGAFVLVREGKFTDADLNDEGNAFTRSYFDLEIGSFLDDYEATLGKNVADLYYVEDTWENFDRLKPVLDRRLKEWRARQC
jgi:hypothetical protein